MCLSTANVFPRLVLNHITRTRDKALVDACRRDVWLKIALAYTLQKWVYAAVVTMQIATVLYDKLHILLFITGDVFFPIVVTTKSYHSLKWDLRPSFRTTVPSLFIRFKHLHVWILTVWMCLATCLASNERLTFWWRVESLYLQPTGRLSYTYMCNVTVLTAIVSFSTWMLYTISMLNRIV